MLITVKGKGGIEAAIIAHSKSAVTGKEIVTYRVSFHRFILSEYNTHRQHSKNAASTRAIPILNQIENILNSPAMPVFYGRNKAGMVASDELDSASAEKAESIILEMLDFCSEKVKELHKLGLHKQHAGRYLEPWMMVEGVITGTEYDNFFWLRNDSEAQPEIQELARCMWEAKKQSVAEVLQPGEWHVPYVNKSRDAAGKLYYWHFISETEKIDITLEQALKVSASCCAQVSYRKSDDSLEKAENIYNRMVTARRVHASPFEHQATPMENEFGEIYTKNGTKFQEGVTHHLTDGTACSGNFVGFIQHRQLIPNNVCNNYKDNDNV